MKALKETAANATEVIAHDVRPLTVNTDARAYTKLGWFIVLAGVGGSLLWALLAPLDKGVPAIGTVTKETNKKTIQYLNGGIVDDILVKDGDIVKAGQVLVRMNSTATKAQADINRIQLYTSRAMEARLLAERDGKEAVTYPKDLLAHKKDDARLASIIEGQNLLFSSRRLSLQTEMAASKEGSEGIETLIRSQMESQESKKVQLAILKEQVDNMRDLVKEGYVARSRLMDQERLYAQISGSIAEDTGNIGRGKKQILELSLRREQRLQEYQKEVRAQLTDVQKEAEALSSRMTSQDFDLANTDIKAPVDGVVVGVNLFTRGGVVGAGARIMDIVPIDDAMVVEGQIPVNLVDKLKTNLPVELNFSAFNTNKTPHIPGVVTQVSADRMIDEHTGQPYYKFKAKVTPEGLKLIAKHKLEIRPGMPVDLFVKTGERTMMNYLLKPIFDRAKSSLTEE